MAADQRFGAGLTHEGVARAPDDRGCGLDGAGADGRSAANGARRLQRGAVRRRDHAGRGGAPGAGRSVGCTRSSRARASRALPATPRRRAISSRRARRSGAVDGAGSQRPRSRRVLHCARRRSVPRRRDSLDDRFSAAAELFERRARARPSVLDAPRRDLLFDWWAGSLDRQAQLGARDDRDRALQRIVSRAEAGAQARDAGARATYWLAAAARGVDDCHAGVGRRWPAGSARGRSARAARALRQMISIGLMRT